MSYALNRMPFNAGRSSRAPFARGSVMRGWAEPASSAAAASRVLDSVLDECGAGQVAMRSGARVTILRDDRFDNAVRLYRDGHWAIAFDHLATLAVHALMILLKTTFFSFCHSLMNHDR